MLADRLRDRHEDHAGLHQFRLERRRDRHRIEHRVDGDARGTLDAGKDLLLAQRDAELLVGLENLRIDLVEGLRGRVHLRRGVVIDLVVIDLRVFDPRPGRLLHGEPAAIGVEPPFEHPVGLALLARNEPDHVLGETLRRLLHLDFGREAVLVLIHVDRTDLFDRLLHSRHRLSPHRSRFQGPRVDGSRLRPFRPRPPSAYIGCRPAFAHASAKRIASSSKEDPPETHAQGALGEAGGDAHRVEHMRAPHLAGGTGGTGRQGDAVEIEGDQRRLGPDRRQREGEGVRQPRCLGGEDRGVGGERPARRPRPSGAGRASSSAPPGRQLRPRPRRRRSRRWPRRSRCRPGRLAPDRRRGSGGRRSRSGPSRRRSRPRPSARRACAPRGSARRRREPRCRRRPCRRPGPRRVEKPAAPVHEPRRLRDGLKHPRLVVGEPEPRPAPGGRAPCRAAPRASRGRRSHSGRRGCASTAAAGKRWPDRTLGCSVAPTSRSVASGPP